MKLFEPITLGTLSLKNPLIMAPMCTYSVNQHDGIATDFHLAHYTARAIGNVGLIIVEATGILPEGRITDDCLGLYDDTQIEPLARIVRAVHARGAKIAIQLNHAGRKCTATDGIDTIYGPSAIAYDESYRQPEALDEAGIERIITAFQASAKRALAAGFDGIEIHGAHGYLLSEFISPLSNQRADRYQDGSVFVEAVVKAVKAVFPKEVWIRLSSTDYEPAGFKVNDLYPLINTLKAYINVVHVSSGGITPTVPPHIYPGYQIADAVAIKQACNIPVIGVGILEDPDLANYLLESGSIDYIALGRGLVNDPNWYLRLCQARHRQDLIPTVYKRAFRG